MAQIEEITKVPSNEEVIKILNQIIKRYNSLANLYEYKGSVETYQDLLAVQNPEVGWVYDVKQEDKELEIAAGSNFAWNGTEWDNLGGKMSGLVKKVNDIIPDSNGNVNINRKFFSSLQSLSLDSSTVTPELILKAMPANSTLTFYASNTDTSGNYIPNLNLPFSAFIIVEKGNNNEVGALFTAVSVSNAENVMCAYGRCTSNANYAFNGWHLNTLSVNGALPDNNGNIPLYYMLPKRVATLEGLNNLHKGYCFVEGVVEDTAFGRVDMQGISMFYGGQAVQLIFTGTGWFYRFDDSKITTETPTYGDWTKLLTEKDVQGWTISKGTNGWARDPVTGFTIQWGNTGNITGEQTITYPRTFTAVYAVIPVSNSTGNYENWGFSANDVPTTTSFKVATRYGGKWRWVAFGIS